MNKKNYLAVLTCGVEQSSVCLYCLDTKAYIQKLSQPHQAHADQLLTLVDRCLQEMGAQPKQLVGVIVNRGPGGFTGVRVACSIAQGIALGLGIPVYGIDALCAQIFAINSEVRLSLAHVGGRVLSVMDARMDELYACVYSYEDDVWIQEVTPFLLRGNDVEAWVQYYRSKAPVHLVGCLDLIDCAHSDVLKSLEQTRVLELEATCFLKSGLHAYEKGLFYLPEQLQPLYVRDKIAFTVQERSVGQGGNPRAKPWQGV